jgi:hypothetical protein
LGKSVTPKTATGFQGGRYLTERADLKAAGRWLKEEVGWRYFVVAVSSSPFLPPPVHHEAALTLMVERFKM